MFEPQALAVWYRLAQVARQPTLPASGNNHASRPMQLEQADAHSPRARSMPALKRTLKRVPAGHNAPPVARWGPSPPACESAI